MITNMFLVTPRDTVNSFFLFRFINNKSGAMLQIREEYTDLVCHKCGKLNEISALDRNIVFMSKIKSKKSFVLSADDFYLTNQNGVLSLNKSFGNLLVFREQITLQ
ncbi:hypothetical protein KIH39_21270 [Telmatocola sphagniphila]|uniref:Uncharacterized protein n=1 Tax=Telmatocola sphagniphila TaxID=1123043 RepID=A0A8E6B4T6_9BACT|nr:hypothetical protein [Telmatocola sphagniphila]QVL31352.1 hypothetical protein KIH39_21270 [Telmatocola sphagniphila]